MIFLNNNNRNFQNNTTNNPFNTGTPANNLFNQGQRQGNPFNNNSTPTFGNNANQGNPFAGSNTPNAPLQGNNMFNNNNNMFNNNNNNTNNNPFNNNNNMFNNNNNNMFNNNMANNNMANNNMFNNNNNNNMFNNNNNNNLLNNGNNSVSGNNQMNYPQYQNQNQMFRNNTFNRGYDVASLCNLGTPESLADFQRRIQHIKNFLEQCSRNMANRNLQSLYLNQYNMFIDKPLNQLPLKNMVVEIMKYFSDLNVMLVNLKKSSDQIQKKMKTFTKDTRVKLNMFQKCLSQTISHERLTKQVTAQLQMMNKEMEQYFKPLYDAYKNRKKISIKQPNQFDLKVSYDVLHRLQILNQRIDDIIACENPPSEEQVQSTTTVFQQLIQYYQNVSCSFYQFGEKYKELKIQAIAEKRLPYEDTMSKVMAKVEENLKNQFKQYNLIKQINDLLEAKNKRQKKKDNQFQI